MALIDRPRYAAKRRNCCICGCIGNRCSSACFACWRVCRFLVLTTRIINGNTMLQTFVDGIAAQIGTSIGMQ